MGISIVVKSNMRFISFDAETFLVASGMVAPRMVCLSYQDDAGAKLLSRVDGMGWLREQLLDCNTILVGHNVAYDLGVACAEDVFFVPLVFQAYKEGRVRCTMVRQMLLDIAAGNLKFRIV